MMICMYFPCSLTKFGKNKLTSLNISKIACKLLLRDVMDQQESIFFPDKPLFSGYGYFSDSKSFWLFKILRSLQ